MLKKLTTTFLALSSRLRLSTILSTQPLARNSNKLLSLPIFSSKTRIHYNFLIATMLFSSSVGAYNIYKAHCKTLEEAQKELEEVSKEHGDESEEALKLYYEIGFFYMHRGQHDECMDAFRKYMRLIKKKFGSESAEFSHALTQVSSVFLFFKNYPLAIDTLREALKIKKKVYGEFHQQIGQCHLNLGIVFSIVKEYEMAIAELNEAYRVFYSVESEGSHFITLSLSTLGGTLKAAGKKSEALQVYEALNQVQNRTLGHNHPETKFSQNVIDEIKKDLRPNSEYMI